MEKPARKTRKKFIPDFEEEHRLLSKRRSKQNKDNQKGFKKKGNPHSFIVDWQLPEKHS